MKLTPLIKGAITGAIMLVTTLCLYYSKVPVTSGWQYIVFVFYGAGIMWTLLAYHYSPAYNGRFGSIFGQGFRCFIIITLVMVVFTGIFSASHPEFAEEDAKYYKEYLVKEGNKLPAEIETEVAKARKSYTQRNISRATFGYLITGAIFTAAGTGLILLMRRK